MRSFAALVAAGLLLGACSFEQDPAAGSGNGAASNFSVAIGIDLDTLDSAGQTTTTVQNVVDYMVETLVKVQDGKIVGNLAEKVETSPDGLTVDLTLRQGVTFHDGTPFNADAVVFNLKRIADPKLRVPLGAPFKTMQSATATGEHSVEITLSKPAPIFLNALTITTAGMISPASVQAEGNTYDNYQHPVGTGPYTFTSFTAGQSLTVTKFPGYWGEKPYYDTVEFRIVPEAATRESLLLAGQVDMIILPPVSDLAALRNNPDVNVILGDSDRSIFIALDNQDPLLSNPQVRQALNYAVDKQAIVDKVLFGAAKVMDAPMSSALFGYCRTGTYAYDPDRARQLLTAAGAQGAALELLTPSGRYVQDQQAAEAIAGYLREVGLNVNVSTSDWGAFLGRVNAPHSDNTVDMHLLGWAPGILDADQQMQMFRSATHPPTGLGTAFYTNPKVEDLLAKADVEIDSGARQQEYCDASKTIWEDAPWIFLWTQSFPVVHSKDVTGIATTPTEKFDALHARPASQ
ncbi:ABC transporter substrate-binding protein [Pseudonocardia adelaidensis]|uniref:Glutathione ABC transporter substrate-binding protein n=1 Tax=Pseudonocardia adelaidensis TaxID=648754 RepID=A0ABP9NZH1_9PSEU